MFKRSIKYIILVIINLIVLTFFYLNYQPGAENTFNTDDVLVLLDSKNKLESEVADLTEKNEYLKSSAEDVQRQIMATRAMIDKNSAALSACRNEQATALALAEQQAKQRARLNPSTVYNAEECSDNAVQASFLAKQLESYKKRITAITTEKNDLLTQSDALRTQIADIREEASRYNVERARFKETIKQLESDLNSDLYLKQVDTTPSYCQPPRFESLVCVERLLVRPRFSRKPYTDVQSSLVNPNGKTVGKFAFDSTKAKLVNFPFPRNSEQPAGEYTIIFVVDGKTINEKITLKH
jgi:FtsZ-binding cell division protein ZapB